MSIPGEDETGLAAGLDAVVRRRFGEAARMVDLERLSGGASQELWSFDVETGRQRIPLILRRNPGGFVQRESAAGMETEARLIGLARGTGTPAPEVVHVCAPEDGLGRGYIMERLSGETIARRILRDPQYAGARQKLARQIGAAAAHIHAVDVAAAGALRVSSPEASLEASYAGYRGYGTPRPVVEWAFRWLRDHLPPPAPRQTVVHGDMRTGNIIVGPAGLVGVLDWEAVHLGDPMEELGWICVTSWRFGEVDKPAGGFGAREELFDGYEAVNGVRPDAERVRWWEVMGTLRWGMSCAMFAKEFQTGDRSVERAAIGRRASETAIDLLAILAPRGAYRHA
jgi:aminoglycoside phosphotransferase (APT) family kinase protein